MAKSWPAPVGAVFGVWACSSERRGEDANNEFASVNAAALGVFSDATSGAR